MEENGRGGESVLLNEKEQEKKGETEYEPNETSNKRTERCLKRAGIRKGWIQTSGG
jgi:hypothetical protein